MILKTLQSIFPDFSGSLAFFKELESIATFTQLDNDTLLLRENAYVNQIPLVLKGLVKVFKEEENGQEILLYYIAPGESCILSIVAAEQREKSKVKAVVEESAELLLIPSNKLQHLRKNYPEWNRLFYGLVEEKFYEIIDRVKTLTFSTKINRLYEYLIKESQIKGVQILNHSHQEIANELGSSREVISRLLKKLENEKKISLSQRKITLL